MNNGIKCVFAFVLGAAAGTVVSWRILKTKYAEELRVARSEIISVYKGRYGKPADDTEEQDPSPYNEKNKEQKAEDFKEYAKLLDGQRYTHYGSIRGSIGVDEPMQENKPYVISPEAFSASEYDAVTLTYYVDGVLEDELGDVVEDVEGTVGLEFINHFDENENDEDTVYVRNERLRTDYEIQRYLENYMDTHPHTEE